MWPETSQVQPFGSVKLVARPPTWPERSKISKSGLAPLDEPVRRAETRRAGAQDDDAAAHFFFRDQALQRLGLMHLARAGRRGTG